MWHQLVHRVGRSSQATPATVDKFLSASNTKIQTPPAALAHQGIVLQPTFIVGPDLVAGRLVELMPAYKSIKLGMYVVYPTRKNLSAKVRALIDFLMTHFDGRGPSF